MCDTKRLVGKGNKTDGANTFSESLVRGLYSEADGQNVEVDL